MQKNVNEKGANVSTFTQKLFPVICLSCQLSENFLN